MPPKLLVDGSGGGLCVALTCCLFTVQFKGAGSTALKVLAALYSNSQLRFLSGREKGWF